MNHHQGGDGMKQTQKTRLLLDLFMAALLPLLMAYELAGEAAHEWFGTAMFLALLLHHWVNRSWHKGLLRGRYTPLRAANAMMDVLLAFDLLTMLVSGIMLSRHLFSFLSVRRGLSLARTAHLLGSYWGLILMAVHAGLHWEAVWAAICKALPFRISRRLRPVLWAVTAALCLFGTYAFQYHKIGTYLFLRTQFVFFDHSRPLPLFLAEYAAIVILFMTAGYVLSLALKRCTTAQRNHLE